jgi:hypothetical protein
MRNFFDRTPDLDYCTSRSSLVAAGYYWVLLPLTNRQCTNARVTQLRVLECTYMSMHVHINTRSGYGFGKAHLYQPLFVSMLGYINYQNINVLFIATLLYINLQYQSSKPVLRIRTIFDWIWIQLLKMSRSEFGP